MNIARFLDMLIFYYLIQPDIILFTISNVIVTVVF